MRVALRGQVAQHVGDEHGFFCREGDGNVGHLVLQRVKARF
jgi:hypothetical protein